MKWDQLEVGEVALVNYNRYIVVAIIKEIDDQTGWLNRNERILARVCENNTVNLHYQITLDAYNTHHYSVDVDGTFSDTPVLTLSSV